MEMSSEKKVNVWTIVKIVLIVGAVCLVAARIYKFFSKKKACKCELAEAETPEALDAAEEEAAEEETFEVPAEAVIANAEDMAEAEA